MRTEPVLAPSQNCRASRTTAHGVAAAFPFNSRRNDGVSLSCHQTLSNWGWSWLVLPTTALLTIHLPTITVRYTEKLFGAVGSRLHKTHFQIEMPVS